MDTILCVYSKILRLMEAEQSLQELQVCRFSDSLGFSLLNFQARIINQNLFSSFKYVFPSLDFLELLTPFRL